MHAGNQTPDIENNKNQYPRKFIVVFFAILSILITLHSTLDQDFFSTTSSYWQNPPTDIATALAGQIFYIKSEWDLPLFLAENIAPPEGRVIIYSDSNPLMSLICKISEANKGCMTEWFYVLFLLQGLSALYLSYALRIKNIFIFFLVIISCLTLPAFIFRLKHPTLAAHFLIITSIAIYFFYRSKPEIKWLYIIGGTACIALTVHAYLTVMVIAIAGALYADALFSKRLRARDVLTAAGLFSLLMPALMFLFGYFHEVGRAPDDFGYNSMNLVSPFIPQLSGLVPWNTPVIDGTGGQHSGLNYLGAGVILTLITGCAVRSINIFQTIKRHFWLACTLAGLTMIAVSNRVYLFDNLILDIGGKLPEENPLHQLRASGRFFWPVAYCFIALAAVQLDRWRHKTIASLLAVFALILQIVDTSPYRSRAQASTSNAAASYEPEVIETLLSHQHIRFIPKYWCAEEAQLTLTHFALHSARAGKTVNEIKFARELEWPRNCENRFEDEISKGIGDNELLVIFRQPWMNFTTPHLDANTECKEFSFGWMCQLNDIKAPNKIHNK